MKKNKTILFTLLVLLLTSCFDDKYEAPPIVYSIVGSYHHDTKQIITDDKLILYATNNEVIKFNKNTRVLFHCTLEKIVDESTAEVKIIDIFDISAPLIYITEENKELFVENYAVEFKNWWIRQDYLTIFFYYWREDKKNEHKFFLSINTDDLEEQEDEKINLTFHHECNSTKAITLMEYAVSVNILEFKNYFPEKDSVELIVSFPVIPTPTDPEKFVKKSIWYKY